MLYKEELIQKMANCFENDKKRIDHSLQVTNYAEELIKLSEGNDIAKTINPAVIIYSAILHDIGIKNSEEKYNSAAAKYQEIEGPPVARDILNSFPIEESIIDEICGIIANHHSPGNIDTYNFKLLYDADWLVNLPDLHDLSKKSNQEIITIIDKLYLTEVGKIKLRVYFYDKPIINLKSYFNFFLMSYWGYLKIRQPLILSSYLHFNLLLTVHL